MNQHPGGRVARRIGDRAKRFADLEHAKERWSPRDVAEQDLTVAERVDRWLQAAADGDPVALAGVERLLQSVMLEDALAELELRREQ